MGFIDRPKTKRKEIKKSEIESSKEITYEKVFKMARSRKRMNVVANESSGRKQVKRSDVSRPTKSRASKTVTMKTGSRSATDNPQPSTSSGASGSSSAPVRIEDDDDDLH